MDKILNYLTELHPEFDFAESDDFINDGYLDSIDITTLVADLEEGFECIIDGMDVRSEYFISIETIAELVRKSGGTLE